MEGLNSKTITTIYGDKTISVHAVDIADLDTMVDVMAVSAFYREYEPTYHTLMEALFLKNIDVAGLSVEPEIDLRELCNIWLSKEIENADLPVRRVGCIELSPYSRERSAWKDKEQQIISSIRAYFRMLDIASLSGIPVETISLPILGGGSQKISMDLVSTPILNECIRFLKSNEMIKHIMIITRDQRQAFHFAMLLEKSYTVKKEQIRRNVEPCIDGNEPLAFISYSSKDRNLADNLCSKLEAEGIRCWYAPRNVVSEDYATAIANAVTRCTHFLIIISQNSLQSEHVLNEINLAFRELKRGIRLLPIRIDAEELGPAFLYYLSRQHWMDARIPPIEQRIEEFVQKIKADVGK